MWPEEPRIGIPEGFASHTGSVWDSLSLSLSLSLSHTHTHTTHTPNPRTHARRVRESKRRRAMILAALVMNTQGKPRITKFYVPLVCTPTPASFRLWTFFFCICTSLSLCASLSLGIGENPGSWCFLSLFGHWGAFRILMFARPKRSSKRSSVCCGCMWATGRGEATRSHSYHLFRCAYPCSLLPQGSCLHLSSPLLKTEEFVMWLEMMMMMILEINQVPKNWSITCLGPWNWMLQLCHTDLKIHAVLWRQRTFLVLWVRSSLSLSLSLTHTHTHTLCCSWRL